MARLAYIAHGLRGSLYNTMSLLGILRNRGHTVQLLSHRDLAADAEASGIEFVQLIHGADAQATLAKAVEHRGRLRSLPLSLRLRRSVVHSQEVVDRLEQFGPDLTLIDAEMHGAVLRCSAAGIKIATVVPWHSVFHRAGLPPMHTELTPDTDSAVIDAAWTALIRQRQLAWTVGRLDPRKLPERVMPFPANSPDPVAVSAVARACGISLRNNTSRREWMHPHVFRKLPMLSYTARELDFGANPPSSFQYLGPVINPERAEPLVTDGAREQLGSFVAAAAAQGRRVVYCTMGSLQAATQSYYNVVIEAFADRPEWALVIGLGGRGDRTEGLAASAENVLVLEYAPQLDGIRAAAVVVHTGGTGTLYECLRYGVPSLVRQTGHVDMPGIAARVDYLQLGHAISEREFVPDQVRRLASHVTSDETIQRNLDRTIAVLREYESRDVAAQKVEALIDTPSEQLSQSRTAWVGRR